MSDISEIMWKTMSPFIKISLDDACDDIEKNPAYKIQRYYEKNVLVGFCIYHDENGWRWLDEAHYIGEGDKFIALKMWKWASKGTDKFLAKVHRANEKIWQLYLRLGFKIKEDNKYFLILQRGE